MNTFRVLEIKKTVFSGNDERAKKLRNDLEQRGVFLLNVMSSPGSGKTTTLVRTILSMKEQFNIGVMEADIDSDVDASTIAATGVKVIQLHTGGMCHLDAEMTREGLDNFDIQGLDLVFLENVGNLICTAEYDTGAARSIMILSVPEGDDKPLKYPVMFQKVDAILVNKIDALPLFDFNLDRFKKHIGALNPRAAIFPISAKTGEGMEAWISWLTNEVTSWKTIHTNQQGA
ncbi:MAG: hydrogenase nickel incorporation protein HypB [Spirochaetota bacterium]|jgi:hydrogenase nickel incorporation protein HypB|uniref:hydrogenase nickel incorporation protein HypB n=1 Tax=Gracilinema caldarium TaxID=215591 RepID=UPI0016B42E98|nr:hydrogenase nickel incorporation protein HypB [Gracilinema caldarium]NLJ10076.1 hydrogenase nickel incorporation protein HypB [Treponema sp.]